MNRKGIGIIVVVAIVIIACMLYSWKNAEDDQTSFDGEWQLTYTATLHSPAGWEGQYPSTVIIEDGVVSGVAELRPVTDDIAVTDNGDIFYLQDRMLFICTTVIVETEDSGEDIVLGYAAYSKDATGTFPGDDDSIAGTYATDLGQIEFGTISMLSVDFTLTTDDGSFQGDGFAMESDGDYYIIGVLDIGDSCTIVDILVSNGECTIWMID